MRKKTCEKKKDDVLSWVGFCVNKNMFNYRTRILKDMSREGKNINIFLKGPALLGLVWFAIQRMLP